MNEIPRARIALSTHVMAKSMLEALPAVEELVRHVSSFAICSELHVEAYWKDQERYRARLVFEMDHESNLIAAVSARLGGAWQLNDEGILPWSVWSNHPASKLIVDSVRWAQLELLERDSENWT